MSRRDRLPEKIREAIERREAERDDAERQVRRE